MSFWCLQFPPKNEQKQVDLRFHSSKVELIRLFFGGNVGIKQIHVNQGVGASNFQIQFLLFY